MSVSSIGTNRPSLYGNFRNKTFNDIYSEYSTFLADFTTFQEAGLDPKLLDTNTLKTIFLLLSAAYGNSTIANASESQFKLKLFSIIFQYAPTWEKNLDIQTKLRNLTDEELRTGSKVIYNHAFNPGTEPNTNTLTELEGINEQNTNNYIKNKIEGYSGLTTLLKTDVTSDFIKQFRKLFLVIVEPELPLWYVTTYDSEEDSND